MTFPTLTPLTTLEEIDEAYKNLLAYAKGHESDFQHFKELVDEGISFIKRDGLPDAAKYSLNHIDVTNEHDVSAGFITVLLALAKAAVEDNRPYIEFKKTVTPLLNACGAHLFQDEYPATIRVNVDTRL